MVKDNKTGELDMHVDKQTIRIWGLGEIREFLDGINIDYRLESGFREDCEGGVPIFVLETLKRTQGIF